MPTAANPEYSSLSKLRRKCRRSKIYTIIPSFGRNHSSLTEKLVRPSESNYSSLRQAYPAYPNTCRTGCRFK